MRAHVCTQKDGVGLVVAVVGFLAALHALLPLPLSLSNPSVILDRCYMGHVVGWMQEVYTQAYMDPNMLLEVSL